LGSAEILQVPQALGLSVRAPARSAVAWLAPTSPAYSDQLAWGAWFLSKGIHPYITLHLLYEILFSPFSSDSDFWCTWDQKSCLSSVPFPASCDDYL